MEFLQSLLSGLEVPFPLAFVIVLALALYVLGNRIKKKSDDPADPTPTEAKYHITSNNLIFGIIAALIWQLSNYLITFGFIFAISLIQYVIIGVIAGITAAGFSTVVYEIVKNKLKLKSLADEETNNDTNNDPN